MTADMTSMLAALHAAQPQPVLAEKLALYGRFVGSWDLDVDYRPFSGAPVRGPGECHFGWVLDGRAVQDVWIFPSRRVHAATEKPYGFYGTTCRWYDPAIDAWHIHWFEPNRAVALHQIGRAQGPDIVQMQIGGTSGLLRRWRYTEITDQSFRWIGDASWDNGATWALELEMRARRIP